MPEDYVIYVYLNDHAGGFRYAVETLDQVSDHLGQIISNGYRHCSDGKLEWFPPHRIAKVKVVGPNITTEYPDEVFRT